MIVTVTLNASVDKAYQITGSVQSGTVMRVWSCRNTAGGKGLNVARVVKLCGADVVASGLAGGHTGALLEYLADRDGLKCRFIRVKGETRCCINVLDENHVSTEFLEPGDSVSGKEVDAFLDSLEQICSDAKFVTISGSVPRGVDGSVYRRMISMAKSWGKKVILDTSGELLREGIKACPDMVKPNQDELEALLGRPLESLEETAQAALQLHRTGIGQVVVSLGNEGALLACEKGVFHGRPPKLSVANTVGCGDSMVAAFAVAGERGYAYEESLQYAVAVSAASAVNPMTGYFSEEMLQSIYPDVTVKRVV